jgi:hypothetical protein
MSFTDLPPWNVPLWFFFWAPIVVLLLFLGVGLLARRVGVARALEGDWDGYSADDVRKLFEIYGETGRQAYRRTLLPADAAFAAVYAITGAVVIAGLVSRGLPVWAAILCGGPWLLGGIADMLEGLVLAKLFDRYPLVADADVAKASALTRVKLVLFALGTAGMVAGFVLAVRPAVFAA